MTADVTEKGTNQTDSSETASNKLCGRPP